MYDFNCAFCNLIAHLTFQMRKVLVTRNSNHQTFSTGGCGHETCSHPPTCDTVLGCTHSRIPSKPELDCKWYGESVTLNLYSNVNISFLSPSDFSSLRIVWAYLLFGLSLEWCIVHIPCWLVTSLVVTLVSCPATTPLVRTSGSFIWISCHEGVSGKCCAKNVVIRPACCSICCVALRSCNQQHSLTIEASVVSERNGKLPHFCRQHHSPQVGLL